MSHGGAAPQVRRKANERLLQGVPKMLTELKRLATDESMPANVRLAAVRDWLDRAGVGEAMKAELTVNAAPWEAMLGEVFLEYDADEEPIAMSADEDGVYSPETSDSRWDHLPRRKPTGGSRPVVRGQTASPAADPDPPRYSRP